MLAGEGGEGDGMAPRPPLHPVPAKKATSTTTAQERHLIAVYSSPTSLIHGTFAALASFIHMASQYEERRTHVRIPRRESVDMRQLRSLLVRLSAFLSRRRDDFDDELE